MSPGNLISHVNKRVGRLVGVDKSEVSLRVACKLADKLNIKFEPICDDLLNIDDDLRFDLIISSNSILPNSREEVAEMFKKLSVLLSSNGRLIAILPSFDTMLYLQELRRRENNLDGSEPILMDEEMLAYADDGYHLQCYHTEKSIQEKIALAGLMLKATPEKAYYPQSQEEIWD